MPQTREIPAIGSPEELNLRGFLRNHHRGERAAITKPRLLENLARLHPPVHLDRRDLDELLRAERAAGFPVAATAAGVFWAVRREELTRARHYVAARFDDLRETVQAYDRLVSTWGRAQLPGAPPGMLFEP